MDVVRITELQPKTYVEQGDYIAIDNQSDGTKKVQFTNLLDDTLSQENKIAPANVVGDEIATIRAAVGSPLKASTVAQMTDKNKIYVYVGSESGYTNGNWYYWNGSAWTSGGVYNSVAVVTDPTLTLSGVPADAKATGDEVTNLKAEINDIIDGFNYLEPYLYKKDIYINSSGVETALSGYNVYKIPVSQGDAICLSQPVGSTPFYNGLSIGYVFQFQNADNSYTALDTGTNKSTHLIQFPRVYEAIFFIPADVKYLIVTSYDTYSNYVVFDKNKKLANVKGDAVSKYKTVIVLDDTNSSKGHSYRRADQKFVLLASPYYVRTIKINAGDILLFTGLVTGLSAYGTFTPSSMTTVDITAKAFVAPSDGIVCIFGHNSSLEYCTLYPANSIMIDSSKVMDGGKSIKHLAGVIRNDGNGWAYIDDSGHEPLNLTSVSVDSSGRLVITYGFTASKVLSLIVTPDETFAQKYTIGGSVGVDQAILFVYSMPITYGGQVTIANNSVTVTNSKFTSGSFNTTTGEIRLSHPSISALNIKEKLNISAICSSTIYDVIIGSQGNDYISLYLKDSSGAVLKDTTGISIGIIATRQINSVPVDANNIVDAGGNFWIYGVMEI